MRSLSLPFFRSVGMMVGAIVGVGILGLPYAFAQSGFAIGLLELLLLGFFLTILQLMFAEVVVQTPGVHRLVFYVEEYLGRFWKWVALATLSLAIWGAMLAYMVVGGRFFWILFSPLFGGSESVYAYAMAGITSLVILGGLALVSRMELFVVSLLLFLFLFIILASLPHIEWIHYASINGSHVFIPYGIALFSLGGLGIVPELKEVLGKKGLHLIGAVIICAMTAILLLYAFFVFAVVGVTGEQTTSSSLEGLIPFIGNSFGMITALLGSITIFSIYTVLGIELLNTLKFDFHRSHLFSWICVCSVPVVLFSFGLKEFTNIIGFVGGVFVAILGILIALTYWNMRRSPFCQTRQCLDFPAPLTWTIIGLFSLGILLEILFALGIL